MEGIILKETEFNINGSTSYTHLERLIMMLGMNSEDVLMAKYLNELSMYSVKLYEYSSLTLAGSILMLLKKRSSQ